MTFSAQSLLTDIYDTWRAHDLDLLATYLPNDFSHFINIPTEMHPLGEARRGKAAVLERFELIFQQFDTKRLETGPSHPARTGLRSRYGRDAGIAKAGRGSTQPSPTSGPWKTAGR
jgi:hypothetical protein